MHTPKNKVTSSREVKTAKQYDNSIIIRGKANKLVIQRLKPAQKIELCGDEIDLIAAYLQVAIVERNIAKKTRRANTQWYHGEI